MVRLSDEVVAAAVNCDSSVGFREKTENKLFLCYSGVIPSASSTDSTESTEFLTTETLMATPSDSGSYVDNSYSVNDLFLLHFSIILFVLAILSKLMFRKMYINLIGGRKGE